MSAQSQELLNQIVLIDQHISRLMEKAKELQDAIKYAKTTNQWTRESR